MTMPYVISESLIEQTAQMISNYYIKPEPAMTRKFTKKDAIYNDDIIHLGRWLKYLDFHDTHPRFIIDGKLIIVEGDYIVVKDTKNIGFSIEGNRLYLVARNITIRVSSIQVEGKKKQSTAQYINQLKSRL